jgi:hypothetical protein
MARRWRWKLWTTVVLFLAFAVAPFGYPLAARVVFLCAAGVELLLALTMHRIAAKTRLTRTTVPDAPMPLDDRELPL